jgi:methylenetetrahydrofolate reductase (NADPH)
MPSDSMTTLFEKLSNGRFVVTSELTPPKGTDLEPLFEAAEFIAPVVDAVNLTDSHSSRMSLAPVAAAHQLMDRGVEPIVQMTTRDRNRIALQSDMLGAAALGVSNLVCMGGDPPQNGDHPDAKPVFDLGTADLIAAANGLNAGKDLAGNALNQPTRFCIGAVVNPGARDLDVEIARLEEKAAAGATFFQTQAVYDVTAFEGFLARIAHLNVRILAGILPIKSVKMARYMNDNVPGIDIPDALIATIEQAADVADASATIAAETIRTISPWCAGVHVMALGWERRIPEILERAGVR